MKAPSLPMKGACRCGRVRFESSGAPLMTSACHCTGCQRMTSSAFSLTASVPVADFSVTAGEPAIGGLHGATRHYFCPYCMSWIFTRPHGLDWIVNVRATMLDDHGWFEPFMEVWRSEGLAWTRTPAVHSFETEPEMDAYEGLLQEYGRRSADTMPAGH